MCLLVSGFILMFQWKFGLILTFHRILISITIQIKVDKGKSNVVIYQLNDTRYN